MVCLFFSFLSCTSGPPYCRHTFGLQINSINLTWLLNIRRQYKKNNKQTKLNNPLPFTQLFQLVVVSHLLYFLLHFFHRLCLVLSFVNPLQILHFHFSPDLVWYFHPSVFYSCKVLYSLLTAVLICHSFSALRHPLPVFSPLFPSILYFFLLPFPTPPPPPLSLSPPPVVCFGVDQLSRRSPMWSVKWIKALHLYYIINGALKVLIQAGILCTDQNKQDHSSCWSFCKK